MKYSHGNHELELLVEVIGLACVPQAVNLRACGARSCCLTELAVSYAATTTSSSPTVALHPLTPASYSPNSIPRTKSRASFDHLHFLTAAAGPTWPTDTHSRSPPSRPGTFGDSRACMMNDNANSSAAASWCRLVCSNLSSDPR